MSSPSLVSPHSNAHPAVRRATLRLETALAEGRFRALGARGTEARVEEGAPERSFRIDWSDGVLRVRGDRARSVLAGALYAIHHATRGTLPASPVGRASPHRDRLVLEDFPFHCYEPRGCEFDAELYAENLVALGFTAMECNRFSASQPLEPYYGNYQFTNPSPAPFVWTPWHEGVWERELVAANAAELRRCIAVAEAFDLEPSVTSFLPRPYPEAFFARHPALRGPGFRHSMLQRGGHAGVHCIDTDHAEGRAFYREVYRALLSEFPGLRHLFFWHADLGTRFWPDGEGSTGRTQAARVAEFHAILREEMRAAGVVARVWVNPWHMPEAAIDELDHLLPDGVGYAIKEGAGVTHFLGTSRVRLADLSVVTGTLGEVPVRLRELAKARGREVCLGQYIDFSEDLDPVLGVPHPLMSFRKMATLRAFGSPVSSANWGVLSPDLADCRVNQDVIREMTWGAEAGCFAELLPRVMPAGLGEEAREAVYTAWRRVDAVLQLWPQFWGLRFQDTGLRLRWLLRPFLLPCTPVSAEEKAYYLDHQVYRIDSATPFGDFMELSDAQAREVEALYADMVPMLREAERALDEAERRAGDATAWEWVAAQRPPVVWMRLFFTTYRNLFTFHRLPADQGPTERHLEIVREELANVDETIAHAGAHLRALVIAHRGKWGQCLGPDFAEDLRRKRDLLERLGRAE